VQGTAFTGLAHLADLYSTIIVGIAGLTMPADTGPIPPDSHNLWDALTSGADSPRSEVVHLPLSNQYANTTVCKTDKDHGCAPSIRVGRYKLLMSWPGGDDLWSLPPPGHRDIPYGQSGGVVEPGTDHAIGPHWGPGGVNQSATCSLTKPCLYDVVSDVSESNNLGDDPQYAHIVANLTARLAVVSKTGSPYNYIVPASVAHVYTQAQADIINVTGAWLPLGYNGTAIPNPIIPQPCTPNNIAKFCNKTKLGAQCRDCCRTHANDLHNDFGCKPKDFSAYCGTQHTLHPLH